MISQGDTLSSAGASKLKSGALYRWTSLLILISSIITIIISVTQPINRNTPSIGTRELVGRAGGVAAELDLLIGSISTIIVTIALPLLRNASMIVTLEFLSGANWLLSVLTVLDVLIRIVSTVIVPITSVLSRDALFGVSTLDGVLGAFRLMETLVSLLIHLIRLIQTIILSVALPLFRDTSSILTLELSGV